MGHDKIYSRFRKYFSHDATFKIVLTMCHALGLFYFTLFVEN